MHPLGSSTSHDDAPFKLFSLKLWRYEDGLRRRSELWTVFGLVDPFLLLSLGV